MRAARYGVERLGIDAKSVKGYDTSCTAPAGGARGEGKASDCCTAPRAALRSASISFSGDESYDLVTLNLLMLPR